MDYYAKSDLIRSLKDAEWIQILPGIRGKAGISGLLPSFDEVAEIGLDLLSMEPATSFPLHTHDGAHILFVLEGRGTVTIDGAVFQTRPHDCYFIPGHLPHAVAAVDKHVLLVIGFPHKQLNDPHRMEIVDSAYMSRNPLFAKIYSGTNASERATALGEYQRTIQPPNKPGDD